MLVYFFSDFGSDGPYAGQVEAVIRSETTADFINLVADAPRTDPYLASYLLAAVYAELPVKKGYMIAVVDPGVGSQRAVIKVTVDEVTIIAPDNGLLSRLIAQNPQAQIDKLLEIPVNISTSFHARDWFAPVVARLINCQPVSTKALKFSQIHGNEWPDEISRIIYIDHYGNLLTGISNLSQQQQLSLAGLKPIAYADTFSSVPAGELFWYYNSMGLVEIAANGGSAAASLSANLGDALQVL